jgi:hypothetical protein
MKKTLLMLVIMGLSMSAFSQMVFTSTSVTYTGNGQTPNGTSGAFYNYQPYASSGSSYVDPACSIPGTGVTTDPNQLGGFDPTFYDLSTGTPAIPGATTYGGAIRTTYFGAGCAAASPSFGVDFNQNNGTATSTVIDLSLAVNQKLSFTYTNTGTGVTTDFPVAIQLYDRTYTGKLTNLPFTFKADGLSHTVNLDLSTYVPALTDMTGIFQLSFVYVSNIKSPNFGISLSNVYIGSSAPALDPVINIKKGTTAGTTVVTTGSATIANTASGSSTNQIFTIESTGTSGLTITNIALSGTNASEYSLSGPTFPYTIVAGSSQAITVTFAPTSVATGKTATLTVTNNDASEGSYTINLSADGVVATGINAAAANISSTKLYPNPTSDQANIQLDLVTPSDVKVTLSDVMGREVMTIAQGSMSSVTQSFSVANLQKGIYTVNYFVNGAAAKAELLMVK